MLEREITDIQEAFVSALSMLWKAKLHLCGSTRLPILYLLLQNHKLQHQQKVLQREITDMQEAFDSALSVLRREKLHLEADVKAAEIKRLTYQQELQLLKVPCLGSLVSFM